MSMSPTLEARSYQLMYAFGNYIRVVSAEEHLTASDSGVVATWKQVCVSGPNDLKVVANLEYVGVGREDPGAKLWGSKYCGVIV